MSDELHPEETEETSLEPPCFSVNTVIDADLQMEASKALARKSTKIVSYVCFALVVASLGVLLWQYFMTKESINLIMSGLVVLALVYLCYSYFSLPKRALRRWEESVLRAYGSRELHLCTEFYRHSLVQTMRENDSVVVQGYSELSELRETEHLFLLRHSKQQWFFIGKEGFTAGTAEEFRKFIAERISA